MSTQKKSPGNAPGNKADAQEGDKVRPCCFPEDLLRVIFQLCLPVVHNSTFSPQDPPLLLTQVCRNWRDVAISMPGLWCSLHIPLALRPSHPNYATTEWLSRAKTLPLSISFGSPRGRPSPTLAQLKPYFEDIKGIPNLFQALSLSLCGNEQEVQELIEHLSHTILGRMWLLKKLTIHVDVISGHHPSGGLNFFSALRLHENHNLRVLELSGELLRVSLPQALNNPLPWANLRVLDLQSRKFYRNLTLTIRTDSLLTILNKCPKLVELRVFLLDSVRSRDFQPGAILNPELRHASLHLTSTQRACYGEFLAHCGWPLLTSLHLGNQDKPREPAPNTWLLQNFNQIGEKWGNQLTSLRFTRPFISPDHFRHLLSRLPHLVQLHIEYGVLQKFGMSVGDDDQRDFGEAHNSLIEFLTPESSPGAGPSEHCCPRLQFFRWDGRTRFSDRVIIGLISNRASSAASPTRLKQVVINFNRGPQDDIGAACARLVADGLRLELAYNVPHPCNSELPGPYRGLRVDEDPLEMGWM